MLGAGASVKSGIPPWAMLAAELCKTFHIEIDEDGDPIAALTAHMNRQEASYNERYTMIRPFLESKTPSIGYAHLAQLVRDELISTVITTNWDHLVETALVRVIPQDRLKVLIRGEIPDDTIADILEWRNKYPTVVKLHGDTQSRVFMLGSQETRRFSEGLTSQLLRCVSGCTFLVGQSSQDIDVLTLLLSRQQNGTLYYMKFDPAGSQSQLEEIIARSNAQIVQGTQLSVVANGISVNIGDFDGFFTQLNLAVQQKMTEHRRPHLRVAEQSILNKEKVGIGYINYTRITELVRSFSYQVKKVEPDIILFVEDPSAPGGTELQRRMAPIMRQERIIAKVARIKIEGQSGSRTHMRAVRSNIADLPMDGVKKVLILDSITFSGKTLRLAREAIRDTFPNTMVVLGVLVMSQQLKDAEALRRDDDQADRILYEILTDRHEIFFPWGVTQTTSEFDRRFEGATTDLRRHVRIARRPWGTIEVLADDELTSSRLLTIEAGRKLSFQRHLCRDELFVALDDNIGLDVCAEELDRKADRYDERVKSLILEKGDYVLIPRGVWHRTKASMDRVRLLEVAFGLYDQDNDIERLWDDYERETKDGTS